MPPQYVAHIYKHADSQIPMFIQVAFLGFPPFMLIQV